MSTRPRRSSPPALDELIARAKGGDPWQALSFVSDLGTYFEARRLPPEELCAYFAECMRRIDGTWEAGGQWITGNAADDGAAILDRPFPSTEQIAQSLNLLRPRGGETESDAACWRRELVDREIALSVDNAHRQLTDALQALQGETPRRRASAAGLREWRRWRQALARRLDAYRRATIEKINARLPRGCAKVQRTAAPMRIAEAAVAAERGCSPATVKAARERWNRLRPADRTQVEVMAAVLALASTPSR